jgi:hypothetical protein
MEKEKEWTGRRTDGHTDWQAKRIDQQSIKTDKV